MTKQELLKRKARAKQLIKALTTVWVRDDIEGEDKFFVMRNLDFHTISDALAMLLDTEKHLYRLSAEKRQ